MVNRSKNISWTPIIIVTLILVFIGVIYFGGNTEEETITISGIDKNQEISNDVPIKLVISGVQNTITIKENTQVNEIILSGVDITIYLPEGSNPKITDSGIRTKIIYY